MLITLWSLKGGAGCSVVAALLARQRARTDPEGAILVDLVGDQPHVLGVPEPDTPGVTDVLERGAGLDPLGMVAVPVEHGLALVWHGRVDWPPSDDVDDAGIVCAAADHPSSVVVDGGCLHEASAMHGGLARRMAEAATRSLLVTRPCYLALRRVAASSVRCDGVIVVDEPGRALGLDDIAAAAGVPVVATLPLDPAVARAVDAGMLSCRQPRGIDRMLAALA